MKITIIVLFVCVLFLVGCNPASQTAEPEVQSEFVGCLIENNVKMYGAFWCSHCADQKKILGNVEGLYIECDPRGENEQAELCIEIGINAYPTFDFGNGELEAKVFSLDELSEKTGCVIG